MEKPSYVTEAQMIALEAHANDFRWDGTPYVGHLEAVANTVAHLGPEYEAAGWLHDLFEDHGDKWDPARLTLRGIPNNVIEAVCLLTRAEGEAYVTYLLTLATCEIASAVKEADNDHNLSTSDPVRNKHVREKWMLSRELVRTLRKTRKLQKIVEGLAMADCEATEDSLRIKEMAQHALKGQ